MATTAAKNYMKAEADKRLSAAIEALAAKHGVEPIATNVRIRDKQMQAIKVTERTADFIESLLSVDSNIPQNYLDAEQLARDGATKADIVAALLGEES